MVEEVMVEVTGEVTPSGNLGEEKTWRRALHTAC
jgi:hypothetical protein